MRSGTTRFDVTWLLLLVSSVARQALQAAVPIVATVVAADGRVDLSVTLLALCGAVAVTCVHATLRELAGAGVGDAGPVARAVSAAAGVAVGLVPQTAMGMLDLGADGWRSIAAASVAAGVLSLVSWWSDPPMPARGTVLA